MYNNLKRYSWVRDNLKSRTCALANERELTIYIPPISFPFLG